MVMLWATSGKVAMLAYLHYFRRFIVIQRSYLSMILTMLLCVGFTITPAEAAQGSGKNTAQVLLAMESPAEDMLDAIDDKDMSKLNVS